MHLTAKLATVALFVVYGWLGQDAATIDPASSPTSTPAVQTAAYVSGFCIFGHNSAGGCRGGSLIPGGGSSGDASSADDDTSGDPSVDSLLPSGPTCPQVVHNDGSVTCVGPAPGTCSTDTGTCYGDPPKLECESTTADTCKVCDYNLDCVTVDSPFTHAIGNSDQHVDPPEYDAPESPGEPAAAAP